MEPKQRVKILTSDPASRKIEGRLRDGGMVQIGAWEVGASFRWPLPDEIWSVQRENNVWALKNRIESSLDIFPIDELLPGELRLDSDEIRDSSGRRLVALNSDDASIGDIITWDGLEWVAQETVSPPSEARLQRFTQSIGSITAGIPVIITHDLHTRDCSVTIYNSTTYEDVYTDIVRPTPDTITLTFSISADAGTYSVVVIG